MSFIIKGIGNLVHLTPARQTAQPKSPAPLPLPTLPQAEDRRIEFKARLQTAEYKEALAEQVKLQLFMRDFDLPLGIVKSNPEDYSAISKWVNDHPSPERDVFFLTDMYQEKLKQLSTIMKSLPADLTIFQPGELLIMIAANKNPSNHQLLKQALLHAIRMAPPTLGVNNLHNGVLTHENFAFFFDVFKDTDFNYEEKKAICHLIAPSLFFHPVFRERLKSAFNDDVLLEGVLQSRLNEALKDFLRLPSVRQSALEVLFSDPYTFVPDGEYLLNSKNAILSLAKLAAAHANLREIIHPLIKANSQRKYADLFEQTLQKEQAKRKS